MTLVDVGVQEGHPACKKIVLLLQRFSSRTWMKKSKEKGPADPGLLEEWPLKQK